MNRTNSMIHMELVLRVVDGGTLAVGKEFAIKGDYSADLPNLCHIQELLMANCQQLTGVIKNISNY